MGNTGAKGYNRRDTTPTRPSRGDRIGSGSGGDSIEPSSPISIVGQQDSLDESSSLNSPPLYLGLSARKSSNPDTEDELPPLSPNQSSMDQLDQELSVLMNQSAQPVKFQWCKGKPKEVQVAGDFNDWQPVAMARVRDNVFELTLDLPAGQHQYKFIVDGEWTHDPKEQTIANAMGSMNNIVQLTTLFHEDDENDVALHHSASKDSMLEETSEFGGRWTPPGDYGQEVPVFKQRSSRVEPPPKLPPHLLQVTLNSESIGNDPISLPQPSHVILNHLYALSVKDHVMVLGASHRYKKKYVTTVLYKPV